MFHTYEIPTNVQQFTSGDTLTLVPNDNLTPITENHRTSISVSNVDEGFQK